MPGLPRFSFANPVAASGVVVTASSEAATYPKTNAQHPESPFTPWRTTVTTASWITFDLLVATLLQIVALVRTTFTAVKIQAHATDLGAGDWTTATYNSGTLTLEQNRQTDRHQHAHIPGAPPTLRYLHLFIPAQTPTDGASYFLLGGVWAGAFTAAPRGFTVEPEWDPEEPHRLIRPESNAWEQKLILGAVRAVWNVERTARVGAGIPGTGDQWGDWLSLDRRMRSAGIYLLDPNYGDPSGHAADVMVARHEGRLPWTPGVGRATSRARFIEVLRS